ncbi:MAG TPA: endonuclease/exonuclease/phosphatase family protein [Pyrinomonadaceae bacterium]|nr:endonuclease/exonuclease/phosphatase family protein [Pyrinomonadaceae bacterium]
MSKLRIATYNIHKCVGIDRRYSPERIAEVLEEIDADVIALQEVLCHSRENRRDHQAEFIANALGMDFRLGENRRIRGGEYGNATLSRLPIDSFRNHEITVSRYEPRGCLRTEIRLHDGRVLQFFNLHMGTSFFERRKQVHNLLADHVLDAHGLAGDRMIAGDFNEWISGITTKLLRSKFRSVEPKLHLGTSRSFPGFLPLMHLDHIYFDDTFTLTNATLHRTKLSRVASDHLPIFADFEF